MKKLKNEKGVSNIDDNKIAELSPFLLVITFHENGLNSYQRVGEWMKINDPTICCL